MTLQHGTFRQRTKIGFKRGDIGFAGDNQNMIARDDNIQELKTAECGKKARLKGFKNNMGRGEHGVATQINFHFGREPAKQEAITFAHEERGLGLIIFDGDGLLGSTWLTAFQLTDSRRISSYN
jgi:hypothetical protein